VVPVAVSAPVLASIAVGRPIRGEFTYLVAEARAVLRRAPAQSAALVYLLAVGGRAPVEEVAHAIPGARETLRKLVTRGFVRIDEEVLTPGVKAGLAQGRPTRSPSSKTSLCRRYTLRSRPAASSPSSSTASLAAARPRSV